MKRLKYYFRLYQEFLRIGMLCLVQYPMDSTIRLISIIAREAAGFLGVFAIANVVGTLGEWSIYGVCLIFSLGAMTEAISRGLLDNVWSIGSFVRKGKLDIFFDTSGFCFVSNADISNGICVVSQIFFCRAL